MYTLSEGNFVNIVFACPLKRVYSKWTPFHKGLNLLKYKYEITVAVLTLESLSSVYSPLTITDSLSYSCFLQGTQTGSNITEIRRPSRLGDNAGGSDDQEERGLCRH